MHLKKMIGNNVYLSPIVEGDFSKFCEWMNNSDITNNLGRSSKITTELSNKLWLENAQSSGKYIFGIIEKDNDSLIGCCGINDIDFIHRTCELYIYIGEVNSRGKGCGKDSLNLLINYAFNFLNLNSIFIKVFDFNTVALNLYKNVGFKEIGIRRANYYLNGKYYDTVYLDLLKEDYVGK